MTYAIYIYENNCARKLGCRDTAALAAMFISAIKHLYTGRIFYKYESR